MLLPLGKLFRSSWGNRLLLLEAALWLLVARLVLLLVPFRHIAPFLGRTMTESAQSEPNDPEFLKQVSWAVRIASRYTLWETKCLVEAMAGKAMLRRRGLASTLYLGLAKDGKGGLKAHAWLRCGSRILTGEKVMEGFTTVAKFAEACRGSYKARSGSTVTFQTSACAVGKPPGSEGSPSAARVRKPAPRHR